MKTAKTTISRHPTRKQNNENAINLTVNYFKIRNIYSYNIFLTK
jgi:hypothetical protein